MKNNTILGIEVEKQTKKEVLEKIRKNIGSLNDFFHIVSLNGETLVIAEEDKNFKKVLLQGSIKLIDGASVALGCSFLGIPYGERIPGADFMIYLLQNSNKRGLRVLFLGGKPNLARDMAKCYQEKYPENEYQGSEGFKDILAPGKAEEDKLQDQIRAFKPHIVFAAFGSPSQELFFYSHRALFSKSVCMGVGGGFDFALSVVPRAPLWMRRSGLEWLFRLAIQPWRWRRQLRLFRFMYLILKQRLTGYGSQSFTKSS